MQGNYGIVKVGVILKKKVQAIVCGICRRIHNFIVASYTRITCKRIQLTGSEAQGGRNIGS